MKIDSSIIGMESARKYTSSNTTIRRFSIMDYQQGLAQGNKGLDTAVSGEKDDSQEKSGNTKDLSAEQTISDWQNRFQISSSHINVRKSPADTLADIREQCFRYLFDLLFYGKTRSYQEDTTQDSSNSDYISGNRNNADSGNGTLSGSVQQNIMGNDRLFVNSSLKVLNYQQISWQAETEATSFSTNGTVRTADGREISFRVDVGMSREFQQYYEQDLNMSAFKMCDPLVINLDTDIASLSDQKFFFDIDADGEMDEISRLGTGSGYLALDKNGDGAINDGSELFGAGSGNGFADLAKYDEDGNGWIDENDAIWDKLKIWCMDENGNNVLYRLSDKGVGAICLQNASTDFTLKGQESGQTNGAIRKTGVFLYENGSAGTIQHVDVAKFNKDA